MIRGLAHTYIITYIASNGSNIIIYDLSEPRSAGSKAQVSPDRLVKIDFNYSNTTKRSYANVVRGKKYYIQFRLIFKRL
jgi:hypothetical protein